MKTVIKPVALCLSIFAYSQLANADSCTIYINSVSNNHNVGIYDCTDNVCSLVESRYESGLEFVPIQAGETDIDLGVAAVNNAQNTGTQKQQNNVLNNCFDPGNGGGGGSAATTLPPVIATAPYPNGYYQIRLWAVNAPGSGNAGNGGSAMRGAGKKEIDVPANSPRDCIEERESRKGGALVALATIERIATRARIGTVFNVTTRDGYVEGWKKIQAGPVTSVLNLDFESSTCPGGGG